MTAIGGSGWTKQFGDSMVWLDKIAGAAGSYIFRQLRGSLLGMLQESSFLYGGPSAGAPSLLGLLTVDGNFRHGRTNESRSRTSECDLRRAIAEPQGMTAQAETCAASPFLPREGIVKTWNGRQGFIKRISHGEDLFFHRYGVAGDYRPALGDRVQFEIASSRSNRVYAVKVRLCD